MLIEVYGEEAVSKEGDDCFKRFKDGRESVEDQERYGRRSTSTTHDMIVKVSEILSRDRQLTL